MKKSLIEEELKEQMLDEAKRDIQKYELECPGDIDILSMKVNYYLLIGEKEQALNYARQGVRRLPLNGDMYFNLAYVYELLGDWINAFLNYQKAKVIYSYFKDEKEQILGLNELSDSMFQKYVEETKQITDCDETIQRNNMIIAINEWSQALYGFVERSFRSYNKIIGGYYRETLDRRRYVGVFKEQIQGYNPDDDDSMDVIHVKAEFLNVFEAEENNSVSINIKGIDASATDILLPIAVSKRNTTHVFDVNDEKYIVQQHAPKHFNYYRVKNDTVVWSSGKSYFGKPIPLKANPKKKRLVLSLFVDGLAQMILNGDEFEKNMPNTYRFFKKGTICTCAYNAAEWTHPSLANIITGLDTIHHMMFHNQLDTAMPEDTPTLAEYFQADGYYTAYLGGDWRMIPTCGHTRGYERFIYQHQKSGFRVNEVIPDALDHIEAFKETNQYCWISVGDLHDIADEDILPVVVHKNLDIKDQTYEEGGRTSAKQNFSPNKIKAYLAMAKYIDRWLQILFSYIEENYTDEEIVISLFADHGQGYFIQNERHFLGKERSNIAMMFRGSEATGIGKTDELISSKDYSSIMRKLARVSIQDVPADGHIPKVFGGNTEWEDVLTESIHPNDPYRATIFSKDVTFFFENGTLVQNDGRFELKDYKYWLENNLNQVIEDKMLSEKYLQKVMEHIAPILIYS